MAAIQQDTQYSLLFYDTDWSVEAALTEFVSCSFTVEQNVSNHLTLEVFSDAPIVGVVGIRSRVNLERKEPGAIIETSFVGEVESIGYDTNQSGREVYTYKVIGSFGILQRSIVAWYAGTDLRSEFINDPIEDIIENIALYNCGTLATTGNSRVRTSDNTNIGGVLATPTSPISIDYRCAWRNVYDAIRELATAVGYYYYLTVDIANTRWTHNLDDSPGNDLKNEVVLSKENGTILSASRIVDFTGNKTVAIVGGGGEGDNRSTRTVTSTAHTTTNSSEIFVDARQTTDNDEMDKIGDARLVESKRLEYFSLELNQTESLGFGTGTGSNFWVGDTITSYIDGTEYSQRIQKSSHSLRAGEKEKVTLTAVNV